jgi:hypothetical protein
MKMNNFKDTLCPACERAFTDKDSVVVCPDCGAPYHRACYDMEGQCIFTELHSKGFVWKAVGKKVPGETESEPKPENKDTFNEAFDNRREKDKKDDGFVGKGAFERLGMFEFEEFKPRESEESHIFGVSEKEIVCFQGGGNIFRFMRYRRIAAGNKISFNIFAGFFSSWYMFFSRMRAAGVLLAVAGFLLNLPSMIQVYLSTMNVVSPFEEGTLQLAASVLSMLNFALTIVVALFFDYFYLRWMTGRIKYIRSHFSSDALSNKLSDLTAEAADEYYRHLYAAGKPSFLYMLLDSTAVSAAMMVLFYFVMFRAL